jgi:DNA-directed RNA polymerase specialized sigma54-like protein
MTNKLQEDLRLLEHRTKDLHPKIQEMLRNRLLKTEEKWNTEAKLWYRGILGKDGK